MDDSKELITELQKMNSSLSRIAELLDYETDVLAMFAKCIGEYEVYTGRGEPYGHNGYEYRNRINIQNHAE